MNNKGRNLLIIFFMYAGSILLLMLCPDRASSSPYLDSAHGNYTPLPAYGVKRDPTLVPQLDGYSRGNCAHCHEQHASIGGSEPAPNTGDDAGPDIYLLFKVLWVAPPQSNEFCFGCHIGIGSYQSSWGRTPDFACYSYRAGGDTSLTCPASVYESFQFVTNVGVSQLNCGSSVGSSHMLRDIRDLLNGKWGFGTVGANIDPCSGCHNPHRAKRDYPCSRPTAHATLTTWNVWGDDLYPSGESMRDFTSNYWAPCRYPNTSGNDICESSYEPDGSSTQDGSNMPDYTSLCVDCHNSTRVIYSNKLDRNLYKITWGATGDFHGNKPRDDSGMEWGDLLAPYKVGGSYAKTNYLLSCTDCHEPHGSHNEFLLRKTLNGAQINTIAGTGQWYYWCRSCHVITVSNPMHTTPTYDCMQGGGCHRHGDGTGSSYF